MQYASRLSRLIGQVIDGLIAVVPIVAALIIASINLPMGYIVIIGGVVASIAYYFFADGLSGGGSYAKQWMDMAVVDATTGAPCTFGQSCIRNLLLGLLGPIDWIFIFGERHQRLGDKVARTVVVSRA